MKNTETYNICKDIFLQSLIQEFTEVHGCHTIILYGSRARGDHNSESDYDLMGFHSGDRLLRVARNEDGLFVDAFIYPDTKLKNPDPSLLHIRDGIILTQRGTDGERLLFQLNELYNQGPVNLAVDEIEARRVWGQKMVIRAQRGDAEGDYRRHWILTSLLEDYFLIRGLRFEGPKKSLEELKTQDPDTYNTYVAALKPGASLEEVRRAVVAMTGKGNQI